jgi:hypothetical protein
MHLDATNPKSYPGTSLNVQVLVVGGGGGGGFGHGGGGGGGAVLYNSSLSILLNTQYPIVVGAGGLGNQNNSSNNSGGSSSAFGVTATGGGSGSNESGDDSSGRAGVGGAGANGGGGTYNFVAGGVGTAPTATGWTVYAGNNGGSGGSAANANYPTGGGAGAGGPGENAQTGSTGGAAGGAGQAAGNGGPGVLSSILGVPYYWAGGGGGVTYNTGGIPGNGGIGGGGGGSSQLGNLVGQGGGSALNSGANGNLGNNIVGGAAGSNTGGGGGGGSNENGIGGDGGSGVVIVRYAGPQKATGGIVTSVGGNTVHTFTSVGSSSFTVNGWGDLGGLGNNGTLVNGVGYESSNNGNLLFNGTNQYISVPQSATNNITSNQITFGAWCFPTISNKFQHILVKNVSESRQYGMWLSQNGTSRIFRNLNGVVSQGDVLLSTNWGVNVWNYIILVYNGSTIKIYLNGNEVFSEAATGNIVTTNSDVNIGGEPNQSFFFSGKISNSMIYNRALTATEIQQNFEALRGRYGI